MNLAKSIVDEGGDGIVTYFLLRRENARRDRLTGGHIGLHTIDEDLSDMQNEVFRYVL